MFPNFSPYKLIKLTKEYINKNSEMVFDAWQNAWDDSYWGELDEFDLNDELQYLKSLAEGGHAYALATAAGKIVAFGLITVSRFQNAKNNQEVALYNQMLESQQKTAYLHELVVSSELRGKGYGSSLLDFLLSTVAQEGCHSVLLWTEVESKSQSLYKSRGFKPILETTVKKPNHPSGEEIRLFMLKD